MKLLTRPARPLVRSENELTENAHRELRGLLEKAKNDPEFQRRMAEINERRRTKPQVPGLSAEEAKKIFAAYL
jgi:hypothetical protein